MNHLVRRVTLAVAVGLSGLGVIAIPQVGSVPAAAELLAAAQAFSDANVSNRFTGDMTLTLKDPQSGSTETVRGTLKGEMQDEATMHMVVDYREFAMEMIYADAAMFMKAGPSPAEFATMKWQRVPLDLAQAEQDLAAKGVDVRGALAAAGDPVTESRQDGRSTIKLSLDVRKLFGGEPALGLESMDATCVVTDAGELVSMVQTMRSDDIDATVSMQFSDWGKTFPIKAPAPGTFEELPTKFSKIGSAIE